MKTFSTLTNIVLSTSCLLAFLVAFSLGNPPLHALEINPPDGSMSETQLAEINPPDGFVSTLA